ncbi:aldo/keto reductase [Alicyclobacillus fodiniaquatilis]|uniref:Aldo/keto reductase n=1 Tax=Alicyclobacillus fodiniaquatilis TaxID=1661150 RepID=A0ABW4JJN2_9BACL
MDYTTFGRTELQVSVMGLGGGGHSRLGLSQQKSESESVEIIQKALQLGINFIDTAEAYGTEARIGKALSADQRKNVILSSKYTLYADAVLRKPAQLEQSLDASLKHLNTDYIDVYHLHGVRLQDYDYAQSYLAPELFKMRDKGKIRFLGITEAFVPDPSHMMLRRAVQDDIWDVVMVGFNILNQSAREIVLQPCIEKNIAVLDMFAVRRALTRSDILAEFARDMMNQGLLPENAVDLQNPLGFLIHPEGAVSLPDAAYRFVRYEPGIHCVLSGTGNVAHLEANVESANRAPLPDAHVATLRKLFANINSVSGN